MAIKELISEFISSIKIGSSEKESTPEKTEPGEVSRKMVDADAATAAIAAAKRQTPDPVVGRIGGRPSLYGDLVQEPLAPREMSGEEAAYLHNKGGLTVDKPKHAAESEWISSIKGSENPMDKGLVQVGADKLYTMFNSVEGTGGFKGHSQYEIGSGIKVLDSWLSDDPKNWLKVGGVPVDIRKGITPEQNDTIVREIASKTIESVSKMPSYNLMSENARMYWADLKYNGGMNVESKNPKAMSALKEGKTVEAIAKTLDFINFNSTPSRGLLNRRIAAFNKVSESESGMPPITQYSWGSDGVKVKFAYSKFMTDKVSKAFNDSIDSEGWYKVMDGSKIKDKGKTYEVS